MNDYTVTVTDLQTRRGRKDLVLKKSDAQRIRAKDDALAVDAADVSVPWHRSANKREIELVRTVELDTKRV